MNVLPSTIPSRDRWKKQEKRVDTCDWWELFRADPFECRLPPLLFARHMDFLDELQAPQHIGNIIQAAHFGCKWANSKITHRKNRLEINKKPVNTPLKDSLR